jgi:hypothetical protein
MSKQNDFFYIVNNTVSKLTIYSAQEQQDEILQTLFKFGFLYCTAKTFLKVVLLHLVVVGNGPGSRAVLRSGLAAASPPSTSRAAAPSGKQGCWS